MDANSGEPWTEMDIQDLRGLPRLWEHVCGRGEYAAQGRGRSPPEGKGAWVSRAPKKMVTSKRPRKSPAEAGRKWAIQ
jgi:hypothetical protein